MAYRQFKGALGIVEAASFAGCAFCATNAMFPTPPAPNGASNPWMDSYDLLIALIGFCALTYTQILRYRIGRDPQLAEIYFKPLPEGDVASGATQKPGKVLPQPRWEWTPMARLVVGLAVIAALAAVLLFATHRRHAAPLAAASNDAASGERTFLEEKVGQFNKLAPVKLNGEAEFVEARLTGMGIYLRYNLLHVNKIQIARSGGIPALTKYSRSFLCNTPSNRAVLDKVFLITNEYYDSDGLKVTTFTTKAADCVW